MNAFDRPQGRRPLSPIPASGTKIREGDPGHGTTITGSVRGRGFDPNAAGRGTGLQGMADRLEAICGELAIETSPCGGTTVLGRIPTSGRRS
jgi:signal transduction histidine kinase